MARRDNSLNSRKRRSKRRYTLYYLLAFVLVVAVGLVMSLTVFFKITTINVSGNTMYADDEIIAVSEIMTGDNLLRVPTRRIETKIVENYPYVKAANVKRILPDSVTIQITMAEEAAALRKADGRFMLISPEGRVLKSDIPLCPDEMIPVDGFNLPVVFDGDDLFVWEYEENGKMIVEENSEEKERFERLLELQRKIAENNLSSGIKVIDMSDMLDIRMLYEGRLAICIGSALDMDYKIRFASLAIETEVTDSTVGLLDVSDKPAAHLREYNIYTEEDWPFADDLRAEYERRIVKPQILPEAPPEDVHAEEGTASETEPSQSE